MTVPIHSNAGSHHVYVYIGSPVPQRQTLIVDTGSRYMSFPCLPCTKCGKHHSAFFNSSASTTRVANHCGACTFSDKRPVQKQNNNRRPKKKKTKRKNKKNNQQYQRRLEDEDGNDDEQESESEEQAPAIADFSTCVIDEPCRMDQTYMEGSSWAAHEVEDLVWFGTALHQESTDEYMKYAAIPFTFGCQYSVMGFFTTQYADGILGLAKPNEPASVLQTLVEANAIPRPAFATCFTPHGGTLSLGGSGLVATSFEHETEQQYHLEPMKFSPISRDHGMYSLHVMRMWLGPVRLAGSGQHLKNTTVEQEQTKILQSFQSGKGTLLDSGTTDTYLPKILKTSFQQVWEELVGHEMQTEKAHKFEYDEFRKFPDVTFVFDQNATLVVPASSYMEGVPMKPHNVSRTPQVDPWGGKKALTMRLYFEEEEGCVLGGNTMYHYDILYDLQDNRIGLAKASCGP